jgi:hypothetical protein
LFFSKLSNFTPVWIIQTNIVIVILNVAGFPNDSEMTLRNPVTAGNDQSDDTAIQSVFHSHSHSQGRPSPGSPNETPTTATFNTPSSWNRYWWKMQRNNSKSVSILPSPLQKLF